jgi:hypothetical protein
MKMKYNFKVNYNEFRFDLQPTRPLVSKVRWKMFFVDSNGMVFEFLDGRYVFLYSSAKSLENFLIK